MTKLALGQMIRARRKKLGLTAEKLAITSGIDRTYLSKIERRGYLPSPNVLIKIVNNLKEQPNKYLRLYESLKFGGAIKSWKQKTKSLLK